METYNNEYSQFEDQLLWELHEIRHEIRKGVEKDGYSRINQKANELIQAWRKRTIHGNENHRA
jgi:hypothetical protein